MDSPEYDRTYEVDFAGELGALVSVDAHGHLDDRESELFMATVVWEETADDDSFVFGFEVEHLWRREHPLACDCGDEGCDHDAQWTFSYTKDPEPGRVAVTRFQIASPWSRPSTRPDGPRATRDRVGQFTTDGVDYWPLMCVRHPDEPAVTAIPQERFIDPQSALDGHVHYCGPCRDEFDDRWREALQSALAKGDAR